MHKIYKLIVGQTNNKLQEKTASDSTPPGGQDRPRNHWLPNDPKEVMLLKSIRATPHPLNMPVNEVTVNHNAVREQE